MTTIWTVGHSNHDWQTFAKLLAIGGIEVQLKTRLGALEVKYIFLGAELRGRPSDGSAPDYEAMAAQPRSWTG